MFVSDIFPSYPGSYYILSFILFIVNRLEDALEILDIGRIVDPHFKAFDGNDMSYFSSAANPSFSFFFF